MRTCCSDVVNEFRQSDANEVNAVGHTDRRAKGSAVRERGNCVRERASCERDRGN